MMGLVFSLSANAQSHWGIVRAQAQPIIEGLRQVQQLIFRDERILLLVAAAVISLMLSGTLITYVFKRWRTGQDKGKDKDEFSVLVNLGTPKMPKSISYPRWVTKGQEPKVVLTGLNNLPTNARIVDENGKDILTFNPNKHDGRKVFVIGDPPGSGQQDVSSPARVLQYRPEQDAQALAKKIPDGGEGVRKPAADSSPNVKPDLTNSLTDSANHIAHRSNPVSPAETSGPASLPPIPGELVDLQIRQRESPEPPEFKVVPIEHSFISTLSEVFGDSREEVFEGLRANGVGITPQGVFFQSFLKMLVRQRGRFVRRVRLYKDDHRLIGIQIAFRNTVTGIDKEINFVRQNILIWHMFGPVEVEGQKEAVSNDVAVQLQEAVRKVDELETFELSGDVSGIAATGSTPVAAIQEVAVIQEVNNRAPKLQEIAIEINPVGMASWLMGLFQQRTGLEINENDGQTMVQFFTGQFPDVVSAIEKMESVPRKFKATLAILLIAGEAGLQNNFQSKRILISIDFLLANRSNDSGTTAFVDMSKADRDSPLTIGQSWHLLIDMRDKYEKVLQLIRKPPAA